MNHEPLLGFLPKSKAEAMLIRQVIKGWEVALRTMKLGEIAEIFVREDYTYARDGTRLKSMMPYTALNHAMSVPAG